MNDVLDNPYWLYYRYYNTNGNKGMIYIFVFIAGVIVGVAIESFLNKTLDKRGVLCYPGCVQSEQ